MPESPKLNFTDCRCKQANFSIFRQKSYEYAILMSFFFFFFFFERKWLSWHTDIHKKSQACKLIAPNNTYNFRLGAKTNIARSLKWPQKIYLRMLSIIQVSSNNKFITRCDTVATKSPDAQNHIINLLFAAKDDLTQLPVAIWLQGRQKKAF